MKLNNTNEDYFSLFEEAIQEKIHWDTLMTRPLLYNKEITLYRMGHIKDKYVYPFAKSVGNKLWKGDYVSWWTENPDDCMLHFCQQAKLLLPDFKQFSIVAATPDDGRGYKRSVVFIDSEYFKKNINIFKKIEFYRYTKKFNVKDLSRGQEYAVSEWTYNKKVEPDKIESIKYDECIKNGSVVITDDLESIKRTYSTPKYICYDQKKPWIYYDYMDVKDRLSKREKIVNPEYADIFIPVEELKELLKKKLK